MSIPTPPKNTLVAGSQAGKRVYCVPKVAPIYKELKAAALRGNHWATLAIMGLQALNTGVINTKNVFIKPNTRIAHGNEEYFVILPGCCATVQRQPSDEYHIVDINVDFSYGELQKRHSKPALYRATKGTGNNWNVELSANGTPKDQLARTVVICDRSNKEPKLIAKNTARQLVRNFHSGKDKVLGRSGFDFQHTPGGSGIGGFFNRKIALNPLKYKEINESAILLARSMYLAKDYEGIQWVSVSGGSAVLTQAMNILANQGVTLENHDIMLIRPNTSVHQALVEARRLKLQIGRDFHTSTPFDYIANRDIRQVVSTRRRTLGKGKNEAESYSKLQAFVDVSKGIANVHTGATVLATIAGVSLAAPALTSAAVLSPATKTFVGAMVAAATQLAATAKAGDVLLESFAPNKYNKLKNKL